MAVRYDVRGRPIFRLARTSLPGPLDSPPHLPPQLVFRFHHDVRQHQLLEDLWYNQLGNASDRTHDNIGSAHSWWQRHAPRTYDSLMFPLTGNWIVVALMYTNRQIKTMVEIAEKKRDEATAPSNGSRTLMTGHDPGFVDNIEDEVKEKQEDVLWYFGLSSQIPDDSPERLPADVRNLWGEDTPQPYTSSNESSSPASEATPEAWATAHAVADALGLPRIERPPPLNLPGIPSSGANAAAGLSTESNSVLATSTGPNGDTVDGHGQEPGAGPEHHN